MNTYLSYKLKVLSLIAIIFVVFIHANINIPDSTNFLYENSAFLQYFISQGITRTAVPMFFIISGYLYFISFDGTLNTYLIKTNKIISITIFYYIFFSFYFLLFYNSIF